ncbi:uncharacterized protein LOC133196408 [Saccostrea echinata]|uniref:uncharacterized protein LOC133196408 n=1 Tax=Saccostrea echinata TaxID=191078 RepID=UPI002A82F26B|nr:uncharacterized protein LOC133196408 [Saccostrea echinata]
MQCNETHNKEIQRSLTELGKKIDKLSNSFGQTYKLEDRRFFNAAYGKKVTQSSDYDKQHYLATSVTNGLLLDFSHTKKENNPWLLIDLGTDFYVFEVEIYNVDKVVQCCANRFRDANISVGSSYITMELCGHFEGPGEDKERIVVRCPLVKRVRYVKIQIVKGTDNYLHLAEVQVWATNVL